MMSARITHIIALAVFLVVSGVYSLSPAAATLHGLQVGMEGPDFSLKTIAGETRTLAELKGARLTVLVFWSTWNKKSEKELARLQQLHEAYKGAGLSVVGINVDGQQITDATVARIKELQDRLKIGFPILADQGLATFRDYGVIALPTTVVLDKDKVIVYELAGYPLVGSETLVDFIVSTIEGKKPATIEKSGYQPNKSALRLYNMGKTTLRSKRMSDTAEMWFKKAIGADPKFVLPHLTLGQMYMKRGDAPLAREEFKVALAAEPANPTALCESGLILLNEGKDGEAVALFDAARKAEEGYGPCYYYTGYAYGKSGKLGEALKMFDEAEKINPHDYSLFIYKGKVLEANNDPKRAMEAYRRGVEVILQMD